MTLATLFSLNIGLIERLFESIAEPPYAGGMTKESQFYWGEVRRVSKQALKSAGLNVKCLEAPIYDRVAIKRAVSTGGVPAAFVPDFKLLWNEITSFLNA
jgi:hypothetical protein